MLDLSNFIIERGISKKALIDNGGPMLPGYIKTKTQESHEHCLSLLSFVGGSCAFVCERRDVGSQALIIQDCLQKFAVHF